MIPSWMSFSFFSVRLHWAIGVAGLLRPGWQSKGMIAWARLQQGLLAGCGGRLDGLQDELGRGLGLGQERDVRSRHLHDRRVGGHAIRPTPDLSVLSNGRLRSG